MKIKNILGMSLVFLVLSLGEGFGATQPIDGKIIIDDPSTELVTNGCSNHGPWDNTTSITYIKQGYPKSIKLDEGQFGFFVNSTCGTLSSGRWIDTNGKYGNSCNKYSIAVGDGSKALGWASSAFGSSTASGISSTAFGEHTTASGNYATTSGFLTLASGEGSVALGKSSKAIGEGSVALGYNANANGRMSFATGYATSANADYSSVMGYGVSNPYAYSILFGINKPILLINNNGIETYTNIIMKSPNGMKWTCGPNNIGEFKCGKI